MTLYIKLGVCGRQEKLSGYGRVLLVRKERRKVALFVFGFCGGACVLVWHPQRRGHCALPPAPRLPSLPRPKSPRSTARIRAAATRPRSPATHAARLAAKAVARACDGATSAERLTFVRDRLSRCHADPTRPSSMPGMVEPEDAPEPSEVHNFLTLFFQALTTLNHDEMVLAIITFFPLVLALNATMRWMSGRARPPTRPASHDAGPRRPHASRTSRAGH